MTGLTCSVSKCVSSSSTLCTISTNHGRMIGRITYKLSQILDVFGLDTECVFAHLHMTSDLISSLTDGTRFAIINSAAGVAIVGVMHKDGLSRQVDVIAVVAPRKLQLDHDCPVFHLESIGKAPKTYTMMNVHTFITM